MQKQLVKVKFTKESLQRKIGAFKKVTFLLKRNEKVTVSFASNIDFFSDVVSLPDLTDFGYHCRRVVKYKDIKDVFVGESNGHEY